MLIDQVIRVSTGKSWSEVERWSDDLVYMPVDIVLDTDLGVVGCCRTRYT